VRCPQRGGLVTSVVAGPSGAVPQDGSGTDRTAAVEPTLWWVRLCVVTGVGLLVWQGVPDLVIDRALAIPVVVVATIYGLSIRWWRSVPLQFSSVLDIVLTLAGAATTGGVRSPVMGVLPLALAAVALRFDRRLTLLAAAGAAGGIVLLGFLAPRSGGTTKVVAEWASVWAVLALLTAILVGELSELEIGQRLRAWSARVSANEVMKRDRDRRMTVRMILHDVEAPLASAGMLATFLLKSLNNQQADEAVVQAARELTRSITYLQDLARDLRAAAEKDPGFAQALQPVPVDLHELLVECTERARLSTGTPSSSVQLTVLGALPPIISDPKALRRVFDNIIRNALRHAASYGPIKITVVPGLGTVCIAVEDRGPAIDLEAIAHGPFIDVTTPETVRWHGMGLWIIQELVHAVGGQLTIMHRSGGGNIVSVVLQAQGCNEGSVG
jgi:signal transduction histidine kinase